MAPSRQIGPSCGQMDGSEHTPSKTRVRFLQLHTPFLLLSLRQLTSNSTDILSPILRASSSLGAFVLAILKNRSAWLDKDMVVQASTFTAREYAQCVREVSGREVRLVEVSRETFEKNKELLVKDVPTYEIWAK